MKEPRLRKVNATIQFEETEEVGVFWYSVWVDFVPGTDELFSFESGIIKRNEKGIVKIIPEPEEENTATKEVTYEFVSKLFEQ